MIKHFKIYGERCSGTNYLENILKLNFKITNSDNSYGHKHFFGKETYENSDDTLFVGIIRNPHTWINSLYKTPWHLAYMCCRNKHSFLNKEIYSMHPAKNRKHNSLNIINKKKLRMSSEIMSDRNIYTNERYKNIFELRYTKYKYLTEDLPNKVKNYIFIKYEDLRDDFINTLNKFNKFNLQKTKEYPVNTSKYKNTTRTFKLNTNYLITRYEVYNNKNFNKTIEESIGY